MATPNYQLKKGVLLQAFGDASKTCTNDTLTDSLAEWYLKYYPEKIIYFERVPVTPVKVVSTFTPVPSEIKIIPPAKAPGQELIDILNPPEVKTIKKTSKGKKK